MEREREREERERQRGTERDRERNAGTYIKTNVQEGKKNITERHTDRRQDTEGDTDI